MLELRSKPTLKAQRFVDANQGSPLVYQSTQGQGCFFRLADGKTFDMTGADCESIRGYELRWRHLVAA